MQKDGGFTNETKTLRIRRLKWRTTATTAAEAIAVMSEM